MALGARLFIILPGLAALAACSTIARYPGAKETAQLWDEMSACAQEAGKNPLKNTCAESFKDKALVVQFEKVSLIPGGALEVLADFGDPTRVVTCTVEGKRYRDQVATLADGQIITIQGELKSRSTFGNASYTTSFLNLNPCDIH